MSKYGNKKCELDGIKFDSMMERNYYVELKHQKEKGAIMDFELQPKFLLQPKFKKHGKSYREINYVADFAIITNDNKKIIVDVKGFKTTEFKLKEKMFEYNYPELKLVCVTYVKKYGGWISLEELTKLRKENRRSK